MEIHEAVRELVETHGAALLDDADGFRGILDDILDEGAASAGDINLLVDAVRFNALQSLKTMIAGGADPGRAVEEAGQRLARDRGGDGHTAASWATAVLGYAIGQVPADVLARFGSQRPGATTFQTGLPATNPVAPPMTSPATPPPPATGWPSTQPPPQPPMQSPAASTGYPPPTGSLPRPGSVPAPGSVPNPASGYSYPAPSPAAGTASKKSRKGLWIALAAVFALLAGGGILAAVLAGGDGKKDEPTAKEDPAVDVSAEGLNERYAGVSGAIATGTSDCKAGTAGEGQTEVVECTVAAGTLKLITFEDSDSLEAARKHRIDKRAGTLSGGNDIAAFYEFDPTNSTSTDPAVIYWDNADTAQSAELTGTADAKLASLTAVYTNTQPKVTAPTEPTNPVLREFVEVTMKVSDCERGLSYAEGTTEESMCSPTDDVSVFVARYDNRRDMIGQRRYYRRAYLESDDHGNNDYWRFGTDGVKEGALYGYVDGETPTLYWDWDKAGCNCYAVAYGYGITRTQLEEWWASS